MAGVHTGRGRRLLHVGIAVLRWVWRVLLSVLLLAAIFFQAPWKIDALLVIFLLACTALPCRRRKYFWAAVGQTVLALAVWVFLPDNDGGWRPYAFEKEMETFLVKYRVPDSENAALIYENVFRQWETQDPNEPNVPKDWFAEVRKAAWRSEQHPNIAAWMDYHEPTLKRLMEGSRLEKCFFEDYIRLTMFDPNKMTPTSGMRQLASLLEASANRDWAERGPEAAVEKQLALLRMGGHLSSQPDMVWALSGHAIEGMALGQIDRIVIGNGLDAVHLDLIRRSISSLNADWRRTFEGTLESDKLNLANLWAPTLYQVNTAGQTRRSRDPMGWMRDWMRHMLESGDFEDEETRRHFNAIVHPGYWRKKLDKAAVIPAWFFVPSDPQIIIRTIDKAHQTQFVHPIPEDFNWWQVKFNFEYFIESMARMSVESNQRTRSLFERAETERRGTRLIVALRRYKDEHGSWPADLAAARLYEEETTLTDGWGRFFAYRLNEDTFVLYSTGENGIDENGEYQTEYSGGKWTTAPDDLMIWPERKVNASDNPE